MSVPVLQSTTSPVSQVTARVNFMSKTSTVNTVNTGTTV